MFFSRVKEMSQKEAIELKCRTFNSNPGKLTGFDCPLCLNRGVIAYPGERDVAFRWCTCHDKRIILQNLKKSGISRLATFEEFKGEEEWQRVLKGKAKAFSESDRGWFYMSGQPGCGKTLLCTGILTRFLERGKTARYFLWREDGTRLKSVVSEECYRDEIEPFKTCEVLYIDDLFKGCVSQGDLNLAFEILNHRYLADLITLISSEKSISELVALDEAIGSRIYEKTRGNRFHIPTSKDKNWRLRQ